MKLNKNLTKKLNLIERYVLSKIIKNPKTEFELSKIGFEKAKKWAKSKPHPFNPEKTLWDYAQHWQFDSYLTLYIINESAKDYIKKR